MKTLIIILSYILLLGSSCQKKDFHCSCSTRTVVFSNQPDLTTAYPFDSTFSGRETDIVTNEVIHAIKRQAKKLCKEKGHGGYLSPTKCEIK